MLGHRLLRIKALRRCPCNSNKKIDKVDRASLMVDLLDRKYFYFLYTVRNVFF